MDRSASSLLSWLLAPVAALLVASAVSLPQRAYTGLVVHDGRIVAVRPESPGARAGAMPGDRVVAVSGMDLERDPDRMLEGAVQGRPLLISVQRAGQPLAMWLVPDTLPDGDRRLNGLLLLVASGFVLIGGWVWSERRDPLTRAFFLMCVGFAVLLAPLPHWTRAGAVEEAALAAVTLFLPALFIHFFALFPDRRAPGAPAALVRGGYALAALLFAGSLAIQIARSESASVEQVGGVLQTAAALWFAGGILTALALFARAYVDAGSGDAQRRLRVALIGTVLGAGPLTAFVVIRNLAPSLPLPGEGAVVLLTLLVPGSFAWASVVHAVFDFRIAVRIAVVAAGLGALGGGLYLLGEGLAASWWPDLGAGIAGAALALAALGACVAGPLAPWVRTLGARVIPDSGPVSLAAWVARERDRDERPLEHVLIEACAAVQRFLRLDGCALVTFEPLGAAAHAGVLALPAPEVLRALAAFPAPGVAALEECDLAGSERITLERAGVRWVLAVGEEPRRALLLLGRRLAGSWLGRMESYELARFADHLAILLENAALRRAVHGRVHLDRELREAGAIQAHLLPRRAPVFPTLDCAAAALSSESVGGDYYDFVEGPERDFTLAVGDAAGKGVPAALVLAGVQARFRNEARRGLAPGPLLEALNDELVGLDQPEKFVGLLCARFDVRRATLEFANAGLTPPLVRRHDGRFQELTTGGVLLGVSRNAQYPGESVTLGAGDLVVIYTDGLTEARRGEEMFGVERVRNVLDRVAGRRAAQVLDALLREVREFAEGELDDVTLVVLRQLTDPPGEKAGGFFALKFAKAAAEVRGEATERRLPRPRRQPTGGRNDG